jgi:hypothetical protein
MTHNMTVTVEDPLWKDMKKHSEIRWSVVMKEAVKEKIRALEVLNRLMKKSKLSEKEISKFALDLGKKINR